MKCTHCSASLRTDDRFCSKCGTPVADVLPDTSAYSTPDATGIRARLPRVGVSMKDKHYVLQVNGHELGRLSKESTDRAVTTAATAAFAFVSSRMKGKKGGGGTTA